MDDSLSGPYIRASRLAVLVPTIARSFCWFCLEAIRCSDSSNLHHVFPRYLCRRLKNFKAIKVHVHVTCHKIWHLFFDRKVRGLPEYIELMRPMLFGFAQLCEISRLLEFYSRSTDKIEQLDLVA